MFRVTCKNLLNGKVFIKIINSPYLLRCFQEKCKRSTKIEILDVFRKDWY